MIYIYSTIENEKKIIRKGGEGRGLDKAKEKKMELIYPEIRVT